MNGLRDLPVQQLIHLTSSCSVNAASMTRIVSSTSWTVVTSVQPLPPLQCANGRRQPLQMIEPLRQRNR